ncbi:hypothetical protein ACJO2E_08770 [Marinobacter sp. M1N3S26]|uniref:hypothetical protein n=1 Tax=Marinobacter sp. M1N3S26 TaxID=3382299 RepID=UPI00387B866B
MIPADEWQQWCAMHNIETTVSEMDGELAPDHPAWIRHFEEGHPGSVGWSPEPPGPEWHMLSIHDTEDGPVVIWYREIPHNNQEGQQSVGEWIEYEGLPPDGSYECRMDEDDDEPMAITVRDGKAYKEDGKCRIFMNFEWRKVEPSDQEDSANE